MRRPWLSHRPKTTIRQGLGSIYTLGPSRIADLRGRDAISLWDRVTSGGDQAYWAFADLIAYNRADTVNLFSLRDRLLLAMSERLGFPDWYRRVRHKHLQSS